MPRIVRTAHSLLLTLAMVLVGSVGCSPLSSIDPWEAAKLAYKAKKQADLFTALQQLPAEVYALKLITDCQSDQTKCVEALQILEFAYMASEGEDSGKAKIACNLKKLFALDYLININTSLQLKLADDLSEANAAPIRARLDEIERIQDRYIKQCEHQK